MPGVLPLTIHRGRTTLKHKFRANSWASSSEKQTLYYKTVCPCVLWLPSINMVSSESDFPNWCRAESRSCTQTPPELHLAFLPPSLPAPQLWRAVQACFLSLANLQSQLPGLCSGFPLGLTRGLSTKRRLLMICLETTLYSRGKYDCLLVANTMLCVVVMV